MKSHDLVFNLLDMKDGIYLKSGDCIRFVEFPREALSYFQMESENLYRPPISKSLSPRLAKSFGQGWMACDAFFRKKVFK